METKSEVRFSTSVLDGRDACLARVAVECARVENGASGSHYVAFAVAELARISRQLSRLSVLECNRELTPAQVRKQERLETRACEIGQTLGVVIETQRDPRGSMLRVRIGSETYVIPE